MRHESRACGEKNGAPPDPRRAEKGKLADRLRVVGCLSLSGSFASRGDDAGRGSRDGLAHLAALAAITTTEALAASTFFLAVALGHQGTSPPDHGVLSQRLVWIETAASAIRLATLSGWLTMTTWEALGTSTIFLACARLAMKDIAAAGMFLSPVP